MNPSTPNEKTETPLNGYCSRGERCTCSSTLPPLRSDCRHYVQQPTDAAGLPPNVEQYLADTEAMETVLSLLPTQPGTAHRHRPVTGMTEVTLTSGHTIVFRVLP